MTSKFLKNTNNVFSGVIDVLLKALKGVVISFSLAIISRFLDIVFAVSWLTEGNFLIIFTLLYSFYNSFIKYRKFNSLYIIGWVIGIYIMVFLKLIPSSKALIYILIPIIIAAIRKLIMRD